MGNTSSVFFPDNPKRLNRAQQLANDCQYAQDTYNTSKSQLEAALGPYKDKLDKVLKAFGCRNIDDFDTLILQTATGDALTRWNQVRDNYDKSLIVDQVIMVAEGVVTIVGLTVSVVGSLAGGIGFFAGLAVTADILVALGIIGAIYDIINGAIQRDKLREQINKLFPIRIKAKYAQMQMDLLLQSLPAIKVVYEAFEEANYDKEKILQKFKNGNWLKSLQGDSKKITYHDAGQELYNMDVRRRSWRNEDPNWQAICSKLDSSTVQLVSTAVLMSATAVASEARAATTSVALRSISSTSTPATKPYDAEIQMRFIGKDISKLLQPTFHVGLQEVKGEHQCCVHFNLKDKGKSLSAHREGGPISHTEGTEKTPWIVRFANPDDASKFVVNRKNFKSPPHSDPVGVLVSMGSSFLTRAGTFTQDPKNPAATLMAVYA
ncbi:hypothetical protein DL96DRAFT_997975 [Flagelloscypha sp. PMI_526]|nr:hypothetical protein DL96DRAFT_997975 [Flagelloscypha sp. PMI_526]